MDVVTRWTGRHGLALVEAMRMSRETFAEKSGISVRAIADWPRKRATLLATKTQIDLDRILAEAPEPVQRRFELLLDETGNDCADAKLGPVLVPATRPDSPTAELLVADLHGDPAAAAADPSVAAWHEAALTWLVNDAPAGPARRDVTRVGAGDLARLRSTFGMYEDLDNMHGGANGRLGLAQYLHTEALPLLHAAQPASHRELFSTVAKGMLTLAWMSYDAGLHARAQGYFIEALRIARESGDRSLGASILDAMSHQATFLGKYREAANLAAAARMGTASLAAPTLAAHFYMMEARAFAGAGEAHACDEALSRAAAAFERGDPQDAPEWIRYFDQTELNAELSHCHRDLGRTSSAVAYAQAAVEAANGEFVRSDFFVTMVLAEAYLDQDELEQGCATALKALEIGEQLRSSRCSAYVKEFRQRLTRFGKAKALNAFTIEANRHTLWLPGAA